LSTSITFAQTELLTSKELRKKKEYRSFEEAMIDPSVVYRLRVTGNSSMEFPEDLEKLVNLQSLTFGKESLEDFTKIPASLAKMTKLQTLKLKGVSQLNLKEAFEILAEMENLETLSLFGLGDKIETLPSEISKLTNLKSLGVSKSKSLKLLPKSIQKLKKLEVFYWEEIPSLDVADAFRKFRGLKNMKRLSCFGNNITEIPAEIEYLKNIERLDLSFNDLTTMPDEIGKLKKLKFIDLFSNKKMDVLPKSIGKLKQLENLNLGNNQIKKLPAELINLENLKELYLGGNPMSDEEQEKVKKMLPNTEIIF
jgi:Leucine-rich repeat (LRR) protein